VQKKEALQQIVNNPASSDAERREAQAELDAAKPTPSPLENELLFQHHAACLADVEHLSVHEFCAAQRFSVDADALYLKWLSVSPVAKNKMRQMQKYLEKYFVESYDNMLARYRHGLDSGGDMNALDKDALAFYRNWVDSAVMPEAMKPKIRQLIAALTARTGGRHDGESR
jgi:hypothetical protein